MSHKCHAYPNLISTTKKSKHTKTSKIKPSVAWKVSSLAIYLAKVNK